MNARKPSGNNLFFLDGVVQPCSDNYTFMVNKEPIEPQIYVCKECTICRVGANLEHAPWARHTAIWNYKLV